MSRYSYSLTGKIVHEHIVFSFVCDARGLRLTASSRIPPERVMAALTPPLPVLTGQCSNGQPIAFIVPADASPYWDGQAFWLPAEIRENKPAIPWRPIMIAVCCLVFVVAAWNIGSYALDLHNARRASQALRQVYHAAEEDPTAAPAAFTPAPTDAPPPTATPEPNVTATPMTRLPAMTYPNNPNTVASSKFRKIRRQNEDIVGWLTIEDLLDEAVVQRDNSYYLRRDYRGYHNVNGAIFMDEKVSLSPYRPYTYHLYGHNMKTGAMFGCLRNYENIRFYKNSPFITFDTLYEEGRYVIFAVSNVSTVRTNRHYFDFNGVDSADPVRRQRAIDQLTSASLIHSTVDLQPTDQLLLLITCVDDTTERRIVAARRLRPNETEESVLKLIQNSWQK